MVRITSATALPNLRKKVGRVAQTKSLNKTSHQLGVSRGFARYWKRKHQDTTFHPKQYGGPTSFIIDILKLRYQQQLCFQDI